MGSYCWSSFCHSHTPTGIHMQTLVIIRLYSPKAITIFAQDIQCKSHTALFSALCLMLSSGPQKLSSSLFFVFLLVCFFYFFACVSIQL